MAEDARTPTAWLARTGEGGYALAECIAQDVVALRYHTVPDASNLTQKEIATYVRNAPTVSDYQGAAAILVRFVHDMKEGDLVVTPHLADGRVFFGEVTGPYFFEKKSRVPDLLHLRAVRWIGATAKDDLPEALLEETKPTAAFYELTSHDDWAKQATLSAEAGPLVPPKKATAPKGAVGEKIAAATAKCKECNMTLSPGDIENGLCEACA